MADVNAHNYLPGTVKSIQRGEATIYGPLNTVTNITIAEVNPDKCWVNLSGQNLMNCRRTGFTATNLQITTRASAGDEFLNWEIIEHY